MLCAQQNKPVNSETHATYLKPNSNFYNSNRKFVCSTVLWYINK